MRLFTVRGIPIELHRSFLFLAGLYVVWATVNNGGAGAIQAVIWGLVLFGSVLLHELGHAWAARVKGIQTRRVVLHPFGGFAELDDHPTGNTEIFVAAAGPAVNFALAGASLGLSMLVPFFWFPFIINLALGIFNLLPAMPLDGGKVLRAFWTRRHGYAAATSRALRVSRWIGGIMGVVGLILNSYGLALIGLYIFWVAGKGAVAPAPRSRLAGTGGARRVAAAPQSPTGGAVSWLPSLTPAARGLIIINVVVYALAQIGAAAGLGIAGWLTLDTTAILAGQIWRPITWMWGSAGLFNLVLSMLMLYLFGSYFEQQTSAKRTLQVYLLSGLAGALTLLAVAIPVELSTVSIPYLGLVQGQALSGSFAPVAGLLAAWCGLYWGQVRQFALIGALQVKWMFAILAGITLLSSLLTPALFFCQLGGLAAGLALGRGNLLTKANVWWERRRLVAKQAEVQAQLERFEVIEGGRNDDDGDDKDSNGGNGEDWIH